ncbi:MAG: hypothetical protein ACHQK9_08475 [Reyranellales bacterium]
MSEPMTPAETRDLRAFAGTMIPASARYGVPGADDELIFADILRSLGRDRDDVVAALKRLAGLAAQRPERRLEIANAFRAEGGPALAAIARVILLCYYRDDRVMLALGQEPRPPFPKGHTVEQGDWSLLDPVKARKPFYRRVS